MPEPKSYRDAAAPRQAAPDAARRRTGRKVPANRRALERLRQRLAEAEAALASARDRQQWMEAALTTQRHARQVLEAAVAATYPETLLRIRDVARAAIPRDAIVLVISRGDPELLELDGRRGWHFPRDESGAYAGYYPADATEAIDHLESLVARGGSYLLIPNTAFWWLEHYRDFADHLERVHLRVWRDDRCALYRLEAAPASAPASVAAGADGFEATALPQAPPSADGGRCNILCFPIIDWDYRFQRPQQLMRQFAAAGYPVFYLSHEFRTSGDPYRLRPLADHLQEVSLRGSPFKIRQGLLDARSRDALIASVATLQAETLAGTTVAVVQSAFWWPVVKLAADRFGWPIVYDCLDYHAGFPTSNPVLVEQEGELLERADLVVASSAVLETQARSRNRNVLLLRNACDYDHFARVPPKTPGPRPAIGYYGAIAEWFDADLVADLATRRTDWDFLLVGATHGADLRRLSRLPNVSLPGEQPYAEIPDWLARFDVAILPFKRTPLTEAVNPVKAYEILAAGRPLVSVPLPEMVALRPHVRLATDAAGFVREIGTALERPDRATLAQGRVWARSQSWRKRFECLASALRRVFPTAPGRPSRPARTMAANRGADGPAESSPQGRRLPGPCVCKP